MDTTSVTSESENLVAESLWRDPISKRGRKAVVEGLDVDYLPKRFGLQNVSAFSAHHSDNVFALSNTTADRNRLTLLRVSDSGQTSHEEEDEEGESGSEYKIIGQLTQEYLGSDVCWLNDTLLVGSTNGSAYLYNVKASQDYGKKELGSKVSEYKLNKPKFTQNTVNKSPIRINRVCINPTQPNMFITLQNQLVTIWDAQNVNDPVAVKRVSKTFPLAVDWNHTGNKFAVGGMGKTIKLFDTRMFATVEQNPVVWEQVDAHKDEIRDIKFNPFIPYWLATAGADSVIKLWDLRFTKSHLISLEDHTNAVNRIDWSPSHVDILCSGSSDRSFKLWSLGVKPHNVIATHSTGMELAVIGVAFSRTTPTKSFCVSEGGNFRSFEMTETFMDSLMRSRYNDSDIKERNVEREIYFRRFDKGFENARELAESLSNANQVERAIEILDICYERNPPDPDIDVRDSGDPLLLFEKELSLYSYFIPPNYPTHLSKPADPSTVARISLLKTNLEIQMYVKNEEVHEVLDREREIYDLLNKDISSVSVTTLCSVIQLVKQHDFIKCIEITEALAEIFSSYSHWSDLLPVIRMVVVPTIYDSEESPTKLVNCLLDHELIVEQLSFIKKFNDMLLNTQDNANIIHFYEDNRPKLVLSSDINQMYFKALLATNSFDKFYNEINELIKIIEGFPFCNTLNDIKNSAFPLLKAFVLGPQRAEDDSALHLKELSEVILCILSILNNCKPISSEIEEFLTPNLSQLAIDVEGAFYGLQKLPNGKKLSQQTSKDLLSQLEKFLKKDFAWKTQVETLKSLLNRYQE